MSGRRALPARRWLLSLRRSVGDGCRSALQSDFSPSSSSSSSFFLPFVGTFAAIGDHHCGMSCSALGDEGSDSYVGSSSAESDVGARVKRNDRIVRSKNNRLVVALLKEIQLAADNTQVEQILDARASQLLGPTSWYWLPLLEELARGSRPRLALEVFYWKKKQVQNEASPKEYSKLISLAGRIRELQLAQDLFDEMPARGLRRTSLIYNALIDAYGKNNCTDRALAIFNEMKDSKGCQPNLVTYNTLISMFSRHQAVEEMESMYQECVNAGFSPDKITYNALIWGYMRSLNIEKMEDVYKKLIENGCQPDVITFNALMIGYSGVKSVAKMQKVLDELTKFGLQVNAAIGELMMEAYGWHEMFEDMEAMLELMKDKSVRTGSRAYSIMIESYARAGKLDCAEYSIQRMLANKNLFRSTQTLEAVLTACLAQRAYERLQSVLERVKSTGWILAPSVYGMLISKYVEENMFDKLEEILHDAGTARVAIIEILSKECEKAGKTAEFMAIKERLEENVTLEELACDLKLDNALESDQSPGIFS